ncbi:MAG: glycosyltransferase family 39 protein, partial [Candidatus Omnitrophica bacterium]|nr:glycosyltransferase family 39 protein [Candidatus Omnitrophota bacterium]
IEVYGYKTPALFGDSGYYALRSYWLSQLWKGIRLTPEILQEIKVSYAQSVHLVFISAIYYLFGFDTILSRCFTSLFGVVTAIVFYNIGLEVTGDKRVSKLIFLILLFWPTVLLWSITHLRDTTLIFFTALFMLLVIKFVNTRNILYFIGFLITGFFVDKVRKRILPNLVGITFLSTLVTIKPRALKIIGISLMLVIVVLFLINWEVDYRYIISKMLDFHRGTVLTGGNIYKFMPDKYYVRVYGHYLPQLIESKDLFMISMKSLYHFFVQPTPVKMKNITIGLFCIPLMFGWYFIALSSMLGIYIAFRDKLYRILPIFLYIISFTFLISIVSGNVGTLCRHRDMLLPFYSIFSCIGIINLLKKNKRNK